MLQQRTRREDPVVPGDVTGGRTPSATTAARDRGRVAALAARATTWCYTGSALASLATALFPVLLRGVARVPEPFADLVVVLGWPSLGYGTFLLLLSRSLARRKRVAWWVALVAAVVNTALGSLLLATEVDVVAVAVTAVHTAAVVVLLVSRREFTALSDPLSAHRAGRALLWTVPAWLVVATGATALTDEGGASALERAWYAVTGTLLTVDYLLPLPSAVLVPTWVDLFLAVGGTLLVLAAAHTAFRPRSDPSGLGSDEARLRELLQRDGGADSLGYFALRRDKTAVFSADGRAAVVHRVVGGVSVASGDPLGNEGSWSGAIRAWQEQTRRHAWLPAVVGASEDGGQAYHREGMQVLEVGDEAVLDVAGFSLQGRAVRSLRQAVNRVERTGATVEVARQHQLSPAELGEVRAAADRWRAGSERGFSMALDRVADPRDPDVVVVRCRDASGQLVLVLTFVPWASSGLSLDLMRRDPGAANGVVEFAVTRLLAAAPGMGVERVSLNFAVFRSVFDRGSRLGAGPVLRLWYRTLVLCSRWWQLEQLYRANAKYQPRWEPRYLCFLRTSDVPRIGIAVARAEGFLPGR